MTSGDEPPVAFARSGADAFLATPLLRFVGEPGRRRLVVGQAQVSARVGAEPELTVAVWATWSEAAGWHQEAEPSEVAGSDVFAGLPLSGRPPVDDPHAAVVLLTKAIAESSRNEVYRLRDLRYEFEQRLAALLTNRRHDSLRPLLAQIIEISVAAGRARDQAQAAVRDGLWIWLWDSGAYQRTRPDRDERPVDGPGWLGTQRAAIRHCQAMDAQLAEEVDRLHSLLTSMSAFAVAQDSEAQDRFNVLAATAAAGLGVPALILSLYGADSFLPLDTFDRAWRALVPIGLAVLAVAFAALRWLPGMSRARHYTAATALVAALVSILLFAGALAPDEG
ncbi:hypothetical protein SAMN05421810_102688 [Amycolatopsis arida]|uniref:Mg2+ and Co2+ transporter CorA n=1 Tax=Amycolatopsis arida TaxID=587909 RepID=A0A1I5QLS1_9PSEU|nr:hypothetical protein [Amycolatopsis arida]TDX98892.1 hypothetical protein CLV69_101689 [Amycolatopsis arida]SFP47209.1 hypothetical protein SAMN05421810_102688 [Amycolatopsis arida]